MNEIWLGIKAWTQRLIIAALVLYAILFVYNNSGEAVEFWFWFKHSHRTTVFFLTAGAFVTGIIFTILVSTALRTLKQIRDLRSRSRRDQMERDVADMKAKAAMLQTRPVGGEGVTVQVDKMGG
jgi:uncharacterized integral membrane protein